MFSAAYLRTYVGIGGALLLATTADAQIVRRYAGGGVAVRAPFVRVDVGPYGETSVRAICGGGRSGHVYVGPGQRRRLRPGYAYVAVPPDNLVQPAAPPQAYPTEEQLAAMDLPALVEQLRVLDALFVYELGRFDRPEGWRRYLALPPDALGTPGDLEPSVRLDVLEQQLARFDKVAANERFSKVAESPSFAATHAALRAVVERFAGNQPEVQEGPALVPPQDEEFPHDPGPVTERDSNEELPVPPPNPEPTRMRQSSERSILKQR